MGEEAVHRLSREIAPVATAQEASVRPCNPFSAKARISLPGMTSTHPTRPVGSGAAHARPGNACNSSLRTHRTLPWSQWQPRRSRPRQCHHPSSRHWHGQTLSAWQRRDSWGNLEDGSFGYTSQSASELPPDPCSTDRQGAQGIRQQEVRHGLDSMDTTVVGFGRVSTPDQDPGFQVREPRERGCGRIFTDRCNYRQSERPQFDAALGHLRPRCSRWRLSFATEGASWSQSPKRSTPVRSEETPCWR